MGVIDSRVAADGSIRRRRECPRCLKRRSTMEMDLAERNRLRDIEDRYNVIKSVVDHPFKLEKLCSN